MGRNDEPRLTSQTLKVLGVLLVNAAGETAGSEIAATTKLKSGTLYPILFRLENSGWITSRWESDEPQLLGRPRRRLYRVTAFGKRKISSAFQEVRLSMAGIA
jgi:PadR family transcriptional regulator PadR